MAETTTSKNLVLGLLAFQLDFIDKDQLIDALHSWMVRKPVELGDILVEQGHLSSDLRSLLDTLVEEHIKRHDHDPETSLATVLPRTDVGEDLRSFLNDTNIDLGVTQSLTYAQDDAFIRTGPRRYVDTFSRRFRVLRHHADGGLGRVSIAMDMELNREVAYKELRPESADNPHSRARFLREAEITGTLEHPAVVPVYGFGLGADGHPYYAMRFVRGETFKDAVDRFRRGPDQETALREQGAQFHRLLQCFLTACYAIDFAHSSSIIHRDIKPQNIMVGDFGETCVVDWGLGKRLGERSSEPRESSSRPANDGVVTGDGSVLGTLSYMSPEQAEGSIDDLGPKSDIYGLGATLYYLLTGRAPFGPPNPDELAQAIEKELKGTTQSSNPRVESRVRFELMRDKVRRGTFSPPSNVDIRVQEPLERICLKAMARNPDQRHDNVRQMIEEIEQFFAFQPHSHWMKSIKHFADLIEEDPDESEFRVSLARARLNAGCVLSSIRRFPEALEHLQAAVTDFETLIRDHPTWTDCRRDLAVTRNAISRVLMRTNRSEDAIAEYKRSISDLEAYFESRGRTVDNALVALLQEPDQSGFFRLMNSDSSLR